MSSHQLHITTNNKFSSSGQGFVAVLEEYSACDLGVDGRKRQKRILSGMPSAGIELSAPPLTFFYPSVGT
jgi:hypothetical protein